MPTSWNTRWGTRQVRYDPPTLAEALAAAQGFTDDRDGQVEIAAGLMGVPVAEAKAELRRIAPDRRSTSTLIASSRDKTGQRPLVVVERITSRRVQPAAGRASGNRFSR